MSIALINPYVLEFVPVIERMFLTAGYNAGEGTSTSTTFTARQTLSTTETSGEDYVAFWQIMHGIAATNADSRAQLFETSVRQLQNIEPQDTTDVFSSGGAFPYTSNGAAKTFQIQTSGESTSTHNFSGRALNLLQLDPSELWAFNATQSTTTSTTFTNRVSVTISEPGDYFIIASASAGNASADFRIFDGTTGYGSLTDSMGQDATTYSPYWHVVKLTGLTNETISLQWRSNGGGTAGIRQASIIALKADKFENTYYANDTTTTSTTSNTYVSAFNNTFNIVNPQNYHLVLGSAMLSGSATNSSVQTQLVNTTRNINLCTPHYREMNATSEWYPTVVARIVSFADSTINLSWEFESESNNQAQMRDKTIAIFDLGVQAPPIAFVGSTTVSNTATIPLPDTIEVGDLVIIASFSDNTAQTAATGYSVVSALLNYPPNDTVNTVNYQWCYKFMGATPDTEATGLSTDAIHIAMAFRDIDQSTTFANTIFGFDSTSGMPLVTDSEITDVKGIFLALAFLDDDSIASTVTPPDGFTLIRAEDTGQAGTIMAAYKRVDATGTTESITGLSFAGSGTDAWVSITIPLRQV